MSLEVSKFDCELTSQLSFQLGNVFELIISFFDVLTRYFVIISPVPVILFMAVLFCFLFPFAEVAVMKAT